jgi:homoaconitate hydratase
MRNALNNGFLVLEVPELVNELKSIYKEDKLTISTGQVAKIDFGNSKLSLNEKVYEISPVGAAAQELVVSGGLEAWVKKNLNTN